MVGILGHATMNKLDEKFTKIARQIAKNVMVEKHMLDNINFANGIFEYNSFMIHCLHLDKNKIDNICCWCNYKKDINDEKTICGWATKEEREKSKHGKHRPLKVFDNKDLLKLFNE